MNRKERNLREARNLGSAALENDHRFSEVSETPHAPITFGERLLRAVLRTEIERLSKDTEECRRFFSHFFDASIEDVRERDAYVTNFTEHPPDVVLGYPRTTADFPIITITLVSDEEDPDFLGKYAGQTMAGEAPDDGDQLYEGAFYRQQVQIGIMAQHPDQTLYLYHFVKLVLLGSREALEEAGLIDLHYSGAELAPNEVYAPNLLFMRALVCDFTTLQTVPKLFAYRDGRRLRLAGLFLSDVEVDGVRGGVDPYVPGEDDDAP